MEMGMEDDHNQLCRQLLGRGGGQSSGDKTWRFVGDDPLPISPMQPHAHTYARSIAAFAPATSPYYVEAPSKQFVPSEHCRQSQPL